MPFLSLNQRPGLAAARSSAVVALMCLAAFPQAAGNAPDRLDHELGVLYWADAGSRTITGSTTGSSNPLVLVTGASAQSLVVDPARRVLYWTSSAPPSIQRVSLDDPKTETVVTIERGRPESLALHAETGRVYWTESGTNLVRCAQLDGGKVETLVELDAPPRGIALDSEGEKLYWTTVEPRPAIQRSNLDGSGSETIVPASKLVHPGDIELDLVAGQLYWVDRFDPGRGAIRRARLDGSQVEDVLRDLRSPSALALDSKLRRVYWADLETQEIRMAELVRAGTESAGETVVQVVAKRVGRTMDVDFVRRARTFPRLGVAEGAPRPLSATELETILKCLAEACSEIQTLALDYREEKHLDLFPEPIVATGRIYYRRSTSIRLDTKTPFVSATILADGEVARFIQENDKWRRLRVDSRAALTTVMNQMAAWLRGDLASGDPFFEFSGHTGKKGAILTLRQRKESQGGLIDHLEMNLAPDARRVESVSVYETPEEFTILYFLSELRDIELPKGVFDTTGRAPTDVDANPRGR